ncbi:MAG: FAD-dependent oxidoreductase [Rhodothermaceae bacterium]|nr:FAD-dependent oxidoreductase [Rhodothermaceae bacterium]MXW31959.1 FAD-dependent oxidoreductase [Rhodothermaceae bacterium]MYC05226.1 FAD-dependent oxidoreductase [Rhodothermaceae bacterium]MYE62177.1 FAD-dependent oxidoreductase [Rhodothermaceae bacterium]MYI16328.1 FAD-dependent oxidoreductase [Rhodothermaceae bacterium]
MQTPDVIIVGAGINGLAAAAALSKAGMDTLVLEKRAVAGGLSAYHTFGDRYQIPGFRPYPGGMVNMLNKALGVTLSEPTSSTTAGLRDGEPFEVETLPALTDAGNALITLLGVPLRHTSLRNKSTWLTTFLQTRIKDLTRWIPLNCVDLFNEFDLRETQRCALAVPLSVRTFAGPRSPFGALQLLLHATENISNGHASLAAELEAITLSSGTVLRTGTHVKQIRSDSKGPHVLLHDDTPIYAKFILAACSPAMLRNQLLNPALVNQWPPVRSRGTCAVLALAMDGLPDWLSSARTRVTPGLVAQEQAFDCVKYNTIPPQQTLEIVTQQEDNTVIIYALQTPFQTSDSWAEPARELLIERILNQLPGFDRPILAKQLWVPADIADEFGAPGGHVLHFERDLDQLLFPAPDCLFPGVYWSGHFANRELGQIGAAGLGAARKIMNKRNHMSKFS